MDMFVEQPWSFKTDPWSTFAPYPAEFVQSQFVYKDPLIVSFKQVGKKHVTKLESTLISNSQSGPSFEDQYKFWFNVSNKASVSARIRSNQSFKLTYDHKIDHKSWMPLNTHAAFYSSFKASKSVSNCQIGIGTALISNLWHLDTRLRINCQNISKPQFICSSKLHIVKNKFKFGALGAINFTKQIFSKNSFFVSYQLNPQNILSFWAENQGFRECKISPKDYKNYFQNLKLSYWNEWSQRTKVGVQAGFKTVGPFFRTMESIIEHRLEKSQSTFKGKISSEGSISLNLTVQPKIWSQIMNLTFGVHGENLHQSRRQFKYGLAVDFET